MRSFHLISMAVEMTGIWFAVAVLLIPDIYSKLMLQLVVILFNFLFSKYIVFRQEHAANRPVQE